jgi:hypothetical protein
MDSDHSFFSGIPQFVCLAVAGGSGAKSALALASTVFKSLSG